MNTIIEIVNFAIDNPFLLTFLFLMVEVNATFIYLYLTQSSMRYNLPKNITIPNSTKIISVTISIEHPNEYAFNCVASQSLSLGYYPSSDKVNSDGNWNQSMTINV